MKWVLITGILVYMLLVSCSLGSAQPANMKVVNVMIDADIPASASTAQFQEASILLDNIYGQLNERGLGATFFIVQDIVQPYGRLRLTYIGKDPKFELAMSGKSSDENLSTKSYSEQKTLLQTSKDYVEACKVCGKNEIIASGFMPQSFNQNEDTYKVLDELGIEYDAGFQAGLIYAPGHQDDVWPYKLEGYDFYAVPVSTYNISGQKVPIQDKYFDKKGFTSSQWYDALTGKFVEAQANDQPMVILLTKSISGSGDYLEAFKNFLDFALSNDATFVTTMDLVNMSREEGYMPQAKESGRPEDDESIAISIETLGNTTNITNITSVRNVTKCATCDSEAQINASINN